MVTKWNAGGFISTVMIGSLLMTTLPARADDLPASSGTYLLAQYEDGWGRRSCDDYDDDWDRERCERHWHREERRDRDRRREKKDVEAGIAAGIIGLAVGALIVGAASNAENKRRTRDNRIARCSSRSSTFIGRDGRRYYCR